MKTVIKIIRALFEGLMFGTRFTTEVTRLQFRNHPYIMAFLTILGCITTVLAIVVGISHGFWAGLVTYVVLGTIFNLMTLDVTRRVASETVTEITVVTL